MGTNIGAGGSAGNTRELREFESELMPDISPFELMRDRLDSNLRKNGKFNFGGLDWERIPKERFVKIGKILSKMDSRMPYEEMVERAAFEFIGVDYMESMEASNKFFEENEKKALEYAKALGDIGMVYRALGGIPEIGLGYETRHPTLTGAGARIEAVDDNDNKEKPEKENWFKRHKKLVYGILLALVGGAAAAGAYNKFVYEPNMIREPYRKVEGSTEEKINEFFRAHPDYVGKDKSVDFFRYWLENPELADKTDGAFANLSQNLFFLNYTKSNGYNGLGFLNEYPRLAGQYQTILPPYSANSTFVNLLYRENMQDSRLGSNSTTNFLNTLRNANSLGVTDLQRIDSAWLLDNATAYGVKSLEGLGKAINFSENNDEISLNFDNVLCHSALADAGHFVPYIFKYPYEALYLALQAGDAVYANGIHLITGEQYPWDPTIQPYHVWDGMMKPFVDWRYANLESGLFDSLDKKLTTGELKKMLENGKDSLVVEAAARSLYPFDELMDRDLLGRTTINPLSAGYPSQALMFGVRNMQPDSTVGVSPFIYIYNLLANDTRENNERYYRAERSIWGDVQSDIWTVSRNFWLYKWGDLYYQTDQSVALMESNPEAAMIKGYPFALMRYPSPFDYFVITEADAPYYSKIIGAILNTPTLVLTAQRPDDHTLKHSEIAIVDKNGNLNTYWINVNLFKGDYKIDENPRAVDNYWLSNNPSIYLRLNRGTILKEFTYEELDKILND